MSKSIKEISKIAAEWWADKVACPKFDNGDDSSNGGFAMLLAMMNTKPVDGGARGKFVGRLSGLIEKQLSEGNRVTLDVDYGPCLKLRECAEYAGIATTNFPWKTTMWVDMNHVSVVYGYGANEQYLYSNKSYWEQRIQYCNEAIAEHKGGFTLPWIPDPKEREATVKESIEYQEKNILKYKIEMDKAEE